MVSILRKIVVTLLPTTWLIKLRKLITIMDRLNAIEENQRLLLGLHYNQDDEGLDSRMIFKGREFRVYSQNGEDGLLLYIFSKIGTTNRRFVEFGIGGGIECNTANLSINHGWNGLLIDGDKNNVRRAKYYYHSRPEIKPSQVRIVQSFVTAKNINRLLSDNGIKGEIDLLSIDIDGNDYWVWKAIDDVRPRVVVIEYNASLCPDTSLTIKYDPQFSVPKKYPRFWYHGASLAALAKLGNSKGYVLVGADSTGTNAFFVLRELAYGKLRAVSVEEVFYPDLRRLRQASVEEQYRLIEHFDWVQM